jgi:surface polysaccharide O-acyltransferase-like enzyme
MNKYAHTTVDRAHDKAFIPEDVRLRIPVLRILLVVTLVFLHFDSPYGMDWDPRAGYQAGPLGAATFVVSLIGFAAFAAVPTLSAISGYLFFAGAGPRRAPDFLRKFSGRIKSLVIPLAIWGSLGVAMGLVIRMVEPTAFDPWLNFGDRQPILALIDAAVGVTSVPLASPLWFVRDLIVVVAVSPLVWLLVGLAPVATVAALTALWIAEQNLFIFLRLDCLVFFTIGAALAAHGRSADLSANGTLVVTLAFAGLVLLRTMAGHLFGLTEHDLATRVMMAALRAVGALAAWNLAPLAFRTSAGRALARLGPFAFFLFCAHYPLVAILKEGAGRLLQPESQAALLLHYAAVSTATIAIALAAGAVLQRVAPPVFGVLSGGRKG